MVEEKEITMVASEDMSEEYVAVAKVLQECWKDMRTSPDFPSGHTHVQLTAVEHVGTNEPFIFVSLPEEGGAYIGAMPILDSGYQLLNHSGVTPAAWIQRETFHQIMSLFMRKIRTGWESYHPALKISEKAYSVALRKGDYDN